MTERIRRPDFGHLELAVTFQDRTVPLRAQLAADTELFESVCNENPDNGQQHWVGRASDAERAKVNVAPEILAKYTGVYRGQYLRGPRTVEVSLSGDSLSVAVNGGPKRPLIPHSQTSFSGTGLSYEFVVDGRGMATDVVEGHVSGDYKMRLDYRLLEGYRSAHRSNAMGYQSVTPRSFRKKSVLMLG